MPDENYGFSQTRARLEEIVAQVRKKNTSLEASLDLLEEGVRLANRCTELIDHADWEAAAGASAGDADPVGDESAASESAHPAEDESDITVEDDEPILDDDAAWADEQSEEASDGSERDDESDVERDTGDAGE